VEYLKATINRTTQNAKPVIAPDGSSESWRNPQVDGYVAGSVPPKAAGRGIEWFWNRTQLFFWSKPRQLAGYPDLLRTPFTLHDLPDSP